MKKEIQKIIELTESNLPSTWVTNPYIAAATSENTRKAYRSDIRHFEQWGGRLPASPEHIVNYLQNFAAKLNARTLNRRVTAIKNWHIYQGFVDPTAHPMVRKTLAGIIRVHGQPKNRAWPLSTDDLKIIVNRLLSENSFTAMRDNALLQVAFFGAFRRSELVHIRLEDITFKKEGMEVLIPQSKTDPTHEGQFSPIPYGHGVLCPIRALNNWIERAHIESGYIFRRILVRDTLHINALSPLSVNHILKKHARDCQLPYADQLSSHSLRRGLATCASQSGAGIPAIMRQGRWKQVSTVMEYIEATARFNENAASSVINKLKEETN